MVIVSARSAPSEVRAKSRRPARMAGGCAKQRRGLTCCGPLLPLDLGCIYSEATVSHNMFRPLRAILHASDVINEKSRNVTS